jgi:hypothetical protein
MPIILDGTNGITTDGSAGVIITENVKTASHTLEIADQSKVVAMNNTVTVTVTVPNDSTTNFPTGTVIRISRNNTGVVNLAAAAGVTLSKTGSLAANEEIFIRKRSANNWFVFETPRNSIATGGTLTIGSNFRSHVFTSVGASTLTVT